MDVLIVTGFLGAGKTTLVKRLLYAEIKGIGKLAVIVNEVGKVGIDGTLLAGKNVDMIQLTSGCICCTIQTDFRRAVEEIHDRVGPDLLVVEATGVAQPSDILDVLFYSPLSGFTALKSLITVVDADFFKARDMLGTFYTNQIRFADTIILNKVDLVKPEVVKEVTGLILEMNPLLRILTTTYCEIDLAELFGKDIDVAKASFRKEVALHHHHEWGFQSFSFTENIPLDRKKLIAFVESLPATLFRLKGWVRFPEESAFLDFTAGRYRLEKTSVPRDTALAFVGRNCDETEILTALRGCRKS